MDLAVVELIPRDDGRFEERKPPAVLTSFQRHGPGRLRQLLYAGARTLQARLPAPGDARSPVVVLRLRRRTLPWLDPSSRWSPTTLTNSSNPAAGST